jgi:FkbM family methyltransferase
MKETVYTDANCRQPFRVGHLPFLAAVYAKSKRRFTSRVATAVWQRGFSIVFRLLRLMPVKRTGYFEAKIGSESKRIEFDSRNTQFCSIYDPHYVEFGYEPETTALIDTLLTPDDVFYDVGSNWGHISLHVAGKHSRGQIHAFEPMPSTYRDLCDVVRQAGLDEQITCHNLALSNDDSTKHMRTPDSLTSGNAEVSSDGLGVAVQSARLDDLDLPRPTVMKVDVEGHESEVFEGAKKTLAADKPMIVFESWRGVERRTALKPLLVLRNAGYHFYQPVMLASTGEAYFVDRNPERLLVEKTALGLVEFEMDQRMLLDEHINIVACHDDKRSWIQSLFPHNLNAPVRKKCA